MASVLDAVKYYQQSIEKHTNDEEKILKCIEKLFHLDVTTQHLQETGVGRTVNALRKDPGEVGTAARSLVYKWKRMVASEESDNEGDHRNDSSMHNGNGSGKDSDDNTRQHKGRQEQYERSNSKSSHMQARQMNGHITENKRKYNSSEEEEPNSKKKKHNVSDDDRKPMSVKQEQLSDSETDDSDSESSESDSDSLTSESSREDKHKQDMKIKKEKSDSPERHKSSKSDHRNHDDKKKSSSSKHTHESDKHNSPKSKETSRHESSKSHFDKHKSSDDQETNSDKKHKSDHSSNGDKKESKESNRHNSSERKSSSHRQDKERHSSKSDRDHSSNKESDKHKNSSQSEKDSDKHKSSSQTEKESDKHKSSSRTDKDSEKHKSSSRTDKDGEKHRSSSSNSTRDDKHKSSSERESKHKSKESSSSKDKHSSSSKEKSKDVSKSSSSKEKSSSQSEKHSSDNKSQERKHDRSEERSHKKQEKSSSSSHKSKSSKSDEVPKKKSKKNSNEENDEGIDCGSGASFAEALGMMASPTKPKKKSYKDISPSNSFANDMSPATLLAPTAKLAPIPSLEIYSLPEISPNYKPRPPPKPLPHFTDDEAISAGISSKNQRTKVYSGNKIIGKVTSLYEMCVTILQEHIDALEYTGGVPYDILKPVIDKASPNQLFVLEHFNPYLMEDTDHLWQKHCEQKFRNKKRQEMEAWREMYMRCQEEQESKLKSLTANIRMTQEAKKAPIKQTKMAYVDNFVKPPRSVARKQAIHGTAHSATASPAARVASLASAANVLKGGTPRPVNAAPVSSTSFNKPKKAPLMQKALQFMRGRKR